MSNTFELSESGLRPLREVEVEYLLFAIRKWEGDITKVSRDLRIGRSTIYRMLAGRGQHPRDLRDGAKRRLSDREVSPL